MLFRSAGFQKRASAALTLRGKTLNPALSRAAGRLAQLVEHLVYTVMLKGLQSARLCGFHLNDPARFGTISGLALIERASGVIV